MGKRLVTGLAISVGAGIAIAATRVAQSRLWGARSGGKLTPVTIRVHTAVPRSEQIAVETAAAAAAPSGNPFPQPEPAELQRTLELAEIKVMIEGLDQRSSEMMSTVNQRIDDLQNHLPRFIDVKVTSRIREAEDRLRAEFQDEHSKTVDTFLTTLEQKVLPRIGLVEQAVGAQGEEIGMMRHRMEKTDETLDRVLERIEQVVDSMVTPFPGYANSHVTQISQKAVA